MLGYCPQLELFLQAGRVAEVGKQAIPMAGLAAVMAGTNFQEAGK